MPTRSRTRFGALASTLIAVALTSCAAESSAPTSRPERDTTASQTGTRSDATPSTGSNADASGDAAPSGDERARLFGTSAGETLFDVARGANSGALYVAGTVSENFYGRRNAGALDVFVARLEPTLRVRWLALIGTPNIDEHPALAVDEETDRIYVAGETRGPLADGGDGGGIDVFLAAFDREGHREWSRQFGGDRRDRLPAFGGTLVADGSGIYVPLTTRGSLEGRETVGRADAVVVHVAPDGTEQWRRYVPGPDDTGRRGTQRSSGLALVPESNRLLWVGTSIADGSSDVVAAELRSSSGELLAIRRHHADALAQPAAIAAAEDGYVLAGTYVASAASKTGRDAFVWGFGPEGNRTWRTRIEQAGAEFAADICRTDRTGNAILAGMFEDAFRGGRSRGDRDLFAVEIDSHGRLGRTYRYGSTGRDWARRLSCSESGASAMLTGVVQGNVRSLDHRGDLDGVLIPIR